MVNNFCPCIVLRSGGTRKALRFDADTKHCGIILRRKYRGVIDEMCATFLFVMLFAIVP